MPNQIQKSVAKQRVKAITDAAICNRVLFMNAHLGQKTSALVENNNTGRTPHDISVKILGDDTPNRTICECKIIGIDGETFVVTRD